jgi:pimeloyl-ACP methyl ester carboxylesterase
MTPRQLLVVVSALSLLLHAGTATTSARAASPAPHLLEELLRPERWIQAYLSDDGQRLAHLTMDDGAPGVSVSVTAVDRIGQADATLSHTFASLGRGVRVDSFKWLADGRILIKLFTGNDASSGWYVLEPDLNRATYVPQSDVILYEFVDSVSDQPGTVLMSGMFRKDSRYTKHLLAVNLGSGEKKVIASGSSNTDQWIQQGDKLLRVDRSGTSTEIFSRQSAGSWQKLVRYSTLADSRLLDQMPLRTRGATPLEWYTVNRQDGDETARLYRFDIVTKKMTDAGFAHPKYDLLSVARQGDTLMAVKFVDDSNIDYLFADPQLTKIHAGLKKYFGTGVNVELVKCDKSFARCLLLVNGSNLPAEYHLFDNTKRHVTMFAATRPWLDPARLASTEVRRFVARDGTNLISYLSAPVNHPSPARLIVLPHVGPSFRSWVGFDPLVQTFAARGWHVLRVNQRGAYGFGRRFTDLADGEWHGTLMTDIADAVKDVAAAGIVAPDRVAAYGEGLYGGYVALSGALRQPQVFRAAAVENMLLRPEAAWVAETRFADSEIEWSRWKRYFGANGFQLNQPDKGIVGPKILIQQAGARPPAERSDNDTLVKSLKAAGVDVEFYRARSLLRPAIGSQWRDSDFARVLEHLDEAITK